jgi:glycosyltransferase involved in cell wall biosynthesis
VKKKKWGNKLVPTFLWNTNPGTAHYRIFTPVKALRRLGETVAVPPIDNNKQEGWSPWEGDLQDGPQTIRWAAREADMCELFLRTKVLVTETWHSQAGVAMLSMANSRFPKMPKVVTIDDYWLELPATHRAAPTYKPGEDVPKWMGLALTYADAVICSTKYLAKLTRNFLIDATSSFSDMTVPPVYVCGNYLDSAEWNKRVSSFPVKKMRGVVRIVFEGAYAHHMNLKKILDAMIALLKKYPDTVDFVHVGDQRPMRWDDLPNMKRHPGCNIMDFPQLMTDIRGDIGIAPMEDSLFQRCKSNLRFQTYSMLKMPTVASNAIPYSDCKKYGYVARSEKEWFDILEKLVLDEVARKSMGTKAHNYVKREYGMKACGEKYRNVLREIVKESKK